MKINRSTKCTLRFTTTSKKSKLGIILSEYANVVNQFIDKFWDNCPENKDLLKPVVDSVQSWFTHRLRKVAAREAISMVKANRNRDGEKAIKPIHRGKRMCLSSTIAELQDSKTFEFDQWLHLSSIGNKISLDLPIKKHKHFNNLSERGKRLESYVITKDSVQFCFEIETGPKQKSDRCIGIDTGINALASVSTGKQYGTDIKSCIDRVKRCKHGSKGQKTAVRALHQRMDETAKEVIRDASLVVVENLKNITKNTKKNPKRRLGKSMRRSIGRWNVMYWLETLKRKCEDNRVSFRSVSPYHTSQRCSKCGYTDRMNRKGDLFCCLECSHQDNADLNAAKNILSRFLTGLYGAGCKPLIVSDLTT